MFEDLDDPAVRAFWALMDGELTEPIEDIEPGLRNALMPRDGAE